MHEKTNSGLLTMNENFPAEKYLIQQHFSLVCTCKVK